MHIISTILLVYDRGITSGRNIFDVKALKWDTLCGVAFNPKLEKIWRQVLSKGKLTQFDNRVRLNETIFYVITKPFRIGGVQGELALCFNERQQRKLKESRYDETFIAKHSAMMVKESGLFSCPTFRRSAGQYLCFIMCYRKTTRTIFSAQRVA